MWCSSQIYDVGTTRRWLIHEAKRLTPLPAKIKGLSYHGRTGVISTTTHIQNPSTYNLALMSSWIQELKQIQEKHFAKKKWPITWDFYQTKNSTENKQEWACRFYYEDNLVGEGAPATNKKDAQESASNLAIRYLRERGCPC